jgi:hypothetical protein
MNAIVIQHVTLNELPAAWRAQLHVARNTRVTVRIEEEEEEEEEEDKASQTLQTGLIDNPLFGMWQDRDDTANVAAYARGLREPRFNVDGSRHES